MTSTATVTNQPVIQPAIPAAVPTLTAGGFLTLIAQVNADLPKLQSFIAEVEANPALTAIATKIFPGIAPLIPFLGQIGPWLSFFQGLVTAVSAALPKSNPGS